MITIVLECMPAKTAMIAKSRRRTRNQTLKWTAENLLMFPPMYSVPNFSSWSLSLSLSNLVLIRTRYPIGSATNGRTVALDVSSYYFVRFSLIDSAMNVEIAMSK